MKKLGLITMPLLAVAVLANCSKGNWWDHTKDLTEADIGKIETIKINNHDHRVRLIGIDHDMLADGSGNTAHTTWEFVDLLSDSDGYSLATPWEWEQGDESANYDFLNSNLRKALDGKGYGRICWYQIGQKNQSTTYTSSVINMLPGGLKDVLKEVTKPVAKYTDAESHYGYEVTKDEYVTKLFPLSYSEITESTKETAEGEHQHALAEGSTYQYYKGERDKDSERVKIQIKGGDGALNDSTFFKAHGHAAENYAGVNGYQKESDTGSFYWLRTPRIDEEESAFKIRFSGLPNASEICDNLYPVAPAFCI